MITFTVLLIVNDMSQVIKGLSSNYCFVWTVKKDIDQCYIFKPDSFI